ncbi:MAG: thioredoxin domain-containing protein [Planctomycetes bacterium]|nr:thioredoxin domain-containing protein [Planctomycetota bacterium]
MKILAPILLLALAASCACGKKGRGPEASREQAAEPSPASARRAEWPSGAKNRLIFEKSPYLSQHADNPVDWYPWGREAFEKAKKEDKPIFLSIGYSTCHWCHVMERESFMDGDVAGILNDHFVSIKLDREERPDVDHVYMTACQIMTGSGGWPLSVFLTPEQRPFFAGTYFPKEDRWGRPGFKTLLQRIAEAWKTDRDALLADAKQLTEAIQKDGRASEGELKKEVLDSALKAFANLYDETYGGFAGRHKFPRSIVHEFLMRVHGRTGDAKALDMAEKTLGAMRAGGMYDQLGGGFHRYSTDKKWLVPHFEKMLYDQALLVRAYVQAHQLTGKKEYADTARETIEFVLRDMTSKEGGFLSAHDADSDLPDGKGHAEGAFYVWTPAQVKAVVPGDEGEILSRAFGVIEGGNYEPVEEHEPRGNSVMHVAATVQELAGEFKRSPDEIRQILDEGTRKLLEARNKRPWPHLDDKILTDWNALMIGAMGFAGAVLEEPRYVEAAERAARFLMEKLRKPDGRWLHRYKGGEAGIDAFLDDYAYLVEGFFLLHQATQKLEYLRVAVRTAELMIEDFGDVRGGFFQTAESGEKLVARMKEAYDGALPSGNAVATLALLRLADLCSRDDFRKKAEETLRHFAGTISRYEVGYPYHLCALDAMAGPNQEIVLVGDPGDATTREMLRAVRRRFMPNMVLAVVPPDGGTEDFKTLIPMAAGRPMQDQKTTAYVCENYACQAPTTSIQEMVRQIERK